MSPAGFGMNAIMQSVINDIAASQCEEISLVGWSRGAALAIEIAQYLSQQAYIEAKYKVLTRRGFRAKNTKSSRTESPKIKFLGVFDPVAMAPTILNEPLGGDSDWGEAVTANVDYFVQIVSGNNAGPFRSIGIDEPKYEHRNPRLETKNSYRVPMSGYDHGDIGGDASTAKAISSYKLLRYHADLAGVL